MSENEEEPMVLDITEDAYLGTIDDDIINMFTCMLCFGIVNKPIKCVQCDTLVCESCIPPENLSLDRFSCYKKCGSKTVVGLSRIEKNLLNNLSFKCQHANEHGWEAIVKYEFYKKHLAEDCVHKLVFLDEKKVGVAVVKKAIKVNED